MLFSAYVYISGGDGDGDGECVDVESTWPYAWVGRHVSFMSFMPIDVSGWFLSYIGSVGVVTHRRVLSSESAMNRNHRQK